MVARPGCCCCCCWIVASSCSVPTTVHRSPRRHYCLLLWPNNIQSHPNILPHFFSQTAGDMEENSAMSHISVESARSGSWTGSVVGGFGFVDYPAGIPLKQWVRRKPCTLDLVFFCQPTPLARSEKDLSLSATQIAHMVGQCMFCALSRQTMGSSWDGGFFRMAGFVFPLCINYLVTMQGDSGDYRCGLFAVGQSLERGALSVCILRLVSRGYSSVRCAPYRLTRDISLLSCCALAR